LETIWLRPLFVNKNGDTVYHTEFLYTVPFNHLRGLEIKEINYELEKDQTLEDIKNTIVFIVKGLRGDYKGTSTQKVFDALSKKHSLHKRDGLYNYLNKFINPKFIFNELKRKDSTEGSVFNVLNTLYFTPDYEALIQSADPDLTETPISYVIYNNETKNYELAEINDYQQFAFDRILTTTEYTNSKADNSGEYSPNVQNKIRFEVDDFKPIPPPSSQTEPDWYTQYQDIKEDDVKPSVPAEITEDIINEEDVEITEEDSIYDKEQTEELKKAFGFVAFNSAENEEDGNPNEQEEIEEDVVTENRSITTDSESVGPKP
jgi:hypothetical protein